MTESSNNRFEGLLNKINQLPEDKRQRPRDYLDQDSLWRKHDQEMKEIFDQSRSRFPKPKYERCLPPESQTVKTLRQQLEAMISARYERYYSPAKIRHSRASNWDVPEVVSTFWNDLAHSLGQKASNILGVNVLGLTLIRHPKLLPGIELELDCSIDGELHLFNWGYNPNRKHLNYSYGRESLILKGIHVEPDIEELKKKRII